MSIKNRILRKFGFKKDQNGIINRYLREKGGWETHLTNTKDVILHSSKNKEKESCLVLGSGWLLDVPIDNLKDTFKKVYLVDIVHPKQITHKYRKYKNIEFIKVDISGYIEPVYNFIKKNRKTKTSLNQIVQQFPDDFNKLTRIIHRRNTFLLDILVSDIYR